jgi:hypothetical protein
MSTIEGAFVMNTRQFDRRMVFFLSRILACVLGAAGDIVNNYWQRIG